MRIRQQLVTSRARTTPGINGREWITIHETANLARGANAAAHANLQSGGNVRAASWHWQVDDTEAVQSYLHTVRCWHAGAPGEGLTASIAIEACVNADGDWAQTVRNLAELTRRIMAEEGIPIDRIVQHNRWSGKNCPTRLRAGYAGITWADFLRMVEEVGKPAPTPAPKPAPTTPEEEPNMQIITAPERGQALINTSAIPAYVPLRSPAETQAAGKLAWHKAADLVQLTAAEFDAIHAFLNRGA